MSNIIVFEIIIFDLLQILWQHFLTFISKFKANQTVKHKFALFIYLTDEVHLVVNSLLYASYKHLYP